MIFLNALLNERFLNGDVLVNTEQLDWFRLTKDLHYCILCFFSHIMHYFKCINGDSEWVVESSCPWSHGNWICNYLCSQCLSPLMFWVESLSGWGVQHYVIKFVSSLRQVGGFQTNKQTYKPVHYVFSGSSGSSGFLHHQKWAPRHNWSIVESGIKNHQTNKQTNWMTSYFYDHILSP